MQPKVFDGRQKIASDIRKLKHGDKIKIFRHIKGKSLQTHEGTLDGSPWFEQGAHATHWYVALQGKSPQTRSRRLGYNPITVDVTECVVLVVSS